MAYNAKISAFMTKKTYALALYQMATIYPDCNEGMKTLLERTSVSCQVSISTSKIGTCFYSSVSTRIYFNCPLDDPFGNFFDYTKEVCIRYNEILFGNLIVCGGRKNLLGELIDRIDQQDNYVNRKLSIY
jgi:hypothetical protein